MGQIQIIDCAQNSREWQMARLGIPTASSFDDILTKGQGKTRRAYMLKLAGEILTGEPMEHVVTAAMERGHAMEAEARDLYAFKTGAQIRRVGFIRNNRLRAGCSPDALVGTKSGLEIKTKAPHLLIDLILKDEFPDEHKAQVQGTLLLTERETWDIQCYWPDLPPFIKTAVRDEPYIKNLEFELERFNSDLDAVVADMQRRIEQEATGIGFAAVAA